MNHLSLQLIPSPHSLHRKHHLRAMLLSLPPSQPCHSMHLKVHLFPISFLQQNVRSKTTQALFCLDHWDSLPIFTERVKMVSVRKGVYAASIQRRLDPTERAERLPCTHEVLDSVSNTGMQTLSFLPNSQPWIWVRYNKMILKGMGLNKMSTGTSVSSIIWHWGLYKVF